MCKTTGTLIGSSFPGGSDSRGFRTTIGSTAGLNRTGVLMTIGEHEHEHEHE